MIRIVDIIKNADDNNNKDKPGKADPQPAAAQPAPPAGEVTVKLPPEELAKLYDRIFAALKFVLSEQAMNDQISAQGEIIFFLIDSLVEQLMQKNPDLMPVLERQKAAPDYIHALRMTVHAVKIGLDASYKKGQLKELALVALTSGIEMGERARIGNFKLLTEVMGRQAKLDSEAYKNIINLAEIYDHAAD